MEKAVEDVLARSRRLIDAVGLIVVVPVCAALIVVTALQWSLIDSLTPFGYYPLLLGLWALWFLVGIGALVTYLVRRPRRLGSALPMLVCVATFFVLVFVPVTAIQAKIDFRAHRVEREALVARVLSGELAVDDGLVALGPQEPRLSRGGNEVAVEKVGSGSYVLFFAVRGVLDNYSGYLWVPSGGDPRSFWDLSESESCEIKRYDDHWYWVAHW